MVLRPNADVAWRVVADEVVIVHVPSLVSFVLDQGAGLLWRCLDGASDMLEIFTDMADAYERDVSEIEHLFLPAVETWLGHDLVEEVTNATATSV